MVTKLRNSVMRAGAACVLALFALAGMLSALTENAVAQVLEVQPGSVNVPATRAASVPVTYVVTNDTSEDIITVINSSQATLTFNGPEGSGVLPVNTPIVRNVNLAPDQTIRIRETLTVPQSFLMQALQSGTRTISGVRLFQIAFANGQFTTRDAVFEINLTGSLGGEVQISRIDLRFQNEAVQIIVPQYHPPEVRADVTYTGTGLFRAVWELADPRVTAAGGAPIYRVLRQDRIRLGIGGFSRVKGPKLPADLTGLHVVRFRVLDGPLAGEAPVVRYFVKAASPDGEDWWKRYIRPHDEGEGMVRVPAEPEEEKDSLVIEDATEPEEAPAGEEPAGADDGEPGQ